MSVSLTFRCPDDLAAVINSQVEATGQDKTSVVVGMLRSSLPSLPLIEKNKLPEIAAIYIVWSSNKLLYIGKTGGLRTRFSSHHKMLDFLASGDNVWIAWFTIDSQDSPLLEANLIELLEPELNSVIPGKKTNVFSFRLPDEIVQVLEGLQLEGETLNQTARRFLLENLELPPKQPQPLPTTTTIEELVDKRLEVGLADIRSQLEELRGKLPAR
jgi:GIY-YIG catalytic domain